MRPNRPFRLPFLFLISALLGTPAVAHAQTYAGLVHNQITAGADEGDTFTGGTFFGFHDTARTSSGFSAELFTGQDNAYIQLDPSSHTGLIYTLDLVDVSSADPSLPPRIADVTVGLGTTIESDGERRVDLLYGVGYAGLHAFTDTSSLYGLATLVVSEPSAADRSISWMIDYNGNRPYLKHAPLPGIAFGRRWSEKSWSWLGYPYGRLQVDREEGWRFEGEYDLGRLEGAGTLQIDLQEDLWLYGSIGSRLVGGFDEATDGATRRFYRQHYLEAGVRSVFRFEGVFEKAVPFLDLSIGGGYAFGQTFETGRAIDTAGPTVRLSDEPYFLIVIAGGF
ncbi:MAG: hypothetical protein R3236_02105 [Phycisphaeraceae bacterium]|nr:hypothetical protein [Phycisphaeraceae bacterium]